MITLHEAIRIIQDELIMSEVEREQKGIPALFKTEKLVIELSCIFTELKNAETTGNINAMSIVSLDSKLSSAVSSEKIHKITVEFSTAEFEKKPSNSTPSHNKDSGLFPYHTQKR